MNYFELLKLLPAFNLDLQALESAYFAAQRQFHPDRFVGKPPAERAVAAGRSADINQAYNALKNPLTRAQYLLQLQGIRVGTESDTVKPSQALLVETLEWREEAENPADLPRLENMLNHEYHRAIKTLSEAYDVQAWDVMAQEVLRLGYIIKVRDEVERKMPKKKL